MNSLIETACDIAKRGASEYLTRNNLTANSEVAETTFAASMIQAGIEAAKEASNPPIPSLP